MAIPIDRAKTAGVEATLKSDLIVRIGAAVFIAVTSLLLVSFLYGAETRISFARRYVDLPLLIVVITSFRYRLQCIEDPSERRFWNIWSVAFIAWLAQVLMVSFAPGETEGQPAYEIARDSLFFLFYAALALSLEIQPHRDDGRTSARLRLFDWLAVCIFFFGLLLYFVIVPRLFEPESYLRSSWVFFVVFDLYLSVRLAGLVHDAGDLRWRRIYAWLLAAALLWLISDTLGLLTWVGVIDSNEMILFFDPFLLASYLSVLIAARSRELTSDGSDTVPGKAPSVTSRFGPLMFYATMFPLMHIGMTKTGLLNPSLEPIRETLTLIFLVLLGILAWFYQRLLEGENRRLEYRRVESTDALSRSDARFRSAFESSTAGSIVINSRGIIESINPMAQHIFGHAPEEVIGKNIKVLMPDSFAVEHDRYLQRYKETKERQIIGIGREVIGLRKNGEEFPMHLGIGEMADDSGNSYIGSITDLTELKRIQQQLVRTQKMDAVGQLSGGIAHDFNNILAIILGNLELLESQLESDAEATEFLAAIRKSAQRAVELTQKLLVFSGKHPVAVTVTDINKLLAGMESLISRSLTPEIEIAQHLAEDLWRTEINTGDLEDALINLVLNARDAMPAGGTLTLETRNRVLNDDYCAQNLGAVPGEYVELAVSDTGEGMSRQQQQHIFEPFFTTKDLGIGLGLAMVYGFAKRSAGHVKVYSETGIGSTFRVCLPRAVGAEQSREATDAENQALPRGTQTLLVVDDEEALLALAKTQLERLGYRVLLASHGQHALDVLAEQPHIDLLISDVVMPGGMNGYELAEQATAVFSELKVLLVSGYGQKAMAPKRDTRWTANLLDKPYTMAELAARVQAIMGDALPEA